MVHVVLFSIGKLDFIFRNRLSSTGLSIVYQLPHLPLPLTRFCLMKLRPHVLVSLCPFHHLTTPMWQASVPRSPTYWKLLLLIQLHQQTMKACRWRWHSLMKELYRRRRNTKHLYEGCIGKHDFSVRVISHWKRVNMLLTMMRWEFVWKLSQLNTDTVCWMRDKVWMLRPVQA